MIPLELITMAGGAASGFFFRFLAERAKDRQAQFEIVMGKLKGEDDSRDKAVERVPIDVGKGIRRVIVLCIMFGVILAPFIMSLLGYPIIVEVDQEKTQWLFGMFGGGTRKVYVELYGYLLIPEVRQTLSAIIGFYFGGAAAKGTS